MMMMMMMMILQTMSYVNQMLLPGMMHMHLE